MELEESFIYINITAQVHWYLKKLDGRNRIKNQLFSWMSNKEEQYVWKKNRPKPCFY